MIANVRQVWEQEYAGAQQITEGRKQTAIDAFMYRRRRIQGDEFEQYTLDEQSAIDRSSELAVLNWWNDCNFNTLRQQAFDLLSVPATSAECERVFSSVKRAIRPMRNRTEDRLLEATECLKNWWDKGVIN